MMPRRVLGLPFDAAATARQRFTAAREPLVLVISLYARIAYRTVACAVSDGRHACFSFANRVRDGRWRRYRMFWGPGPLVMSEVDDDRQASQSPCGGHCLGRLNNIISWLSSETRLPFS